MTNDQLETLAGKAGMYTDLFRMGAGSMVYSPGCKGVALDELKRFAELVIESDLARHAPAPVEVSRLAEDCRREAMHLFDLAPDVEDMAHLSMAIDRLAAAALAPAGLKEKAWSCQSGAEDVRRAAQAYADVRIQALHVRAAPEDVRNSHAELLAAIDRLAAPSVMVASKDFEDWWQGWPFSGHKNPQTKGVARRAWDAAQRAAASTPVGEVPAGRDLRERLTARIKLYGHDAEKYGLFELPLDLLALIDAASPAPAASKGAEAVEQDCPHAAPACGITGETFEQWFARRVEEDSDLPLAAGAVNGGKQC